MSFSSFFLFFFLVFFDTSCMLSVCYNLPSHHIRKAFFVLFSLCFVVLISRFMCLQVCNIGVFFFGIFISSIVFFFFCYFDVFFFCSSFFLSLSLSCSPRHPSVIQCTSISFSCTALRVSTLYYICMPPSIPKKLLL